jgi:predicted lysophospholipase L1 biosynthesis ABC-type transport system permease subunit
MAEPVTQNKPEEPKFMRWVRVAMAVGLIVLLAALVVGKATQGSLVAQVLGITGAALLVGSTVISIINGIIAKRRGGASTANAP